MPAGNITRRIPQFDPPYLSLNPSGWNDLINETTSSKAAICQFRISKHSNHFPHAMQQLYQCWSYWNLPVNQHRQKILLRPKNTPGFPRSKMTLHRLNRKVRGKDWGFVAGIVRAWQEAANVTVIDRLEENDDRHTQWGVPVQRQDRANTFLLQSPQHARWLANTVIQYYHIPIHNCNNNQTETCDRNKIQLPRIAILNRRKKSSRSILNTNDIIAALKNELGILDVQVAYFETATFLQQVEFFANADLILSPHGAQLTGIPFMPECGRILEVFPAYYYYDSYFGSLAENSGIEQYTMYLSSGDPVSEWARAASWNSQQRRRYRNVNLCPPVSKIIQAVKLMVSDWQDCHCPPQRQQSHQFSTHNTTLHVSSPNTSQHIPF
jgi:hypothetical protein